MRERTTVLRCATLPFLLETEFFTADYTHKKKLHCRHECFTTAQETVAVCFEYSAKHINTLRGLNSEFLMLQRVVHIATTSL